MGYLKNFKFLDLKITIWYYFETSIVYHRMDGFLSKVKNPLDHFDFSKINVKHLDLTNEI